MRRFKATYRDRRGRPREATKWYVEFTDHQGRRRRLAAYANRKASDEFGRKVERLTSCRAAKLPPDVELTRWIEDMAPNTRERLDRIGLLDRQRAAAGKPLAELDREGKLYGGHLWEFEASLREKDRTDKHIVL